MFAALSEDTFRERLSCFTFLHTYHTGNSPWAFIILFSPLNPSPSFCIHYNILICQFGCWLSLQKQGEAALQIESFKDKEPQLVIPEKKREKKS